MVKMNLMKNDLSYSNSSKSKKWTHFSKTLYENEQPYPPQIVNTGTDFVSNVFDYANEFEKKIFNRNKKFSSSFSTLNM